MKLFLVSIQRTFYLFFILLGLSEYCFADIQTPTATPTIFASPAAQKAGDESVIDNWQTRHEKAVDDKKSLDNGQPIKEVKSPGLSFVLFAIVPGLGQYYNGTTAEIIKGSIQTVGFLIGFHIYINNLDDMAAGRYDVGEGGFSTVALGGFSLLASCYLWSVIDAPISSAEINGEAAKKHAASDFNMHLTFLNDSAFHAVPAADISLRF